MTIKHSENLDQLLSALSKLQGKIENAKKDNAGFNNNYKYAKLEQYIELSKDLLAEHGLSVIQLPGSMEIVEVTKEIYDKEKKSYSFQIIKMPKQKLTTFIGHDSGQFIHSDMELLVEKMVANSWGQCSGVSVSYMRRIARGGGLGMTQEDDDNQLSKEDVEKRYVQSKKPPVVENQKLNKEQINYIASLLVDDPNRLKKMLEWAKVQSIEDLPVTYYTAAVNRLLAEKEAKVEANKNTNLIAPEQAAFISRIVNQERLNKILEKYSLKKLEDMKVEDYFVEYSNLRLENNDHNQELNVKKII